MTFQDIAQLRLRSHMIAEPVFTNPAEVVRALGAVQAQDYGQSLWAIGLRTKNATRKTIEQAIADGTILRTWPMRGTIHFVPSEDAQWMLSLSTPRMIAAAKSRHARLGLDEVQLRKAGHVFDDALSGGPQTRPDLMQALAESGLATHDQRGYHMLWYWAQLGKICIGPMQGKQQTFALLSEWAPNQRELSREQGLAELARRYFCSHGPATLADFSTWASLTKRDAVAGLQAVASELRSETVAGAEYWFGSDMSNVSAQALYGAHLLAGFEEYLLGYKDRSAVLASEFTATSYKNGIFFPIMVADGQIIGTWKRTVGSRKITIRFEPFTPLSSTLVAAFHEKAKSYGAFMDMPIAFE